MFKKLTASDSSTIFAKTRFIILVDDRIKYKASQQKELKSFETPEIEVPPALTDILVVARVIKDDTKDEAFYCKTQNNAYVTDAVANTVVIEMEYIYRTRNGEPFSDAQRKYYTAEIESYIETNAHKLHATFAIVEINGEQYYVDIAAE